MGGIPFERLNDVVKCYNAGVRVDFLQNAFQALKSHKNQVFDMLFYLKYSVSIKKDAADILGFMGFKRANGNLKIIRKKEFKL